MFKKILKVVSLATMGACIASVGFADSADQDNRYVPTIWVDPDGCQHWVMDDGAEGYMTPHVTRDGIPVCRRGKVCAVMNADQWFAVDKFHINSKNRARLQDFFKNAGATAYLIDGHTDSDASDAYNIRLSKNRALAVAKIAQSVGARAGALVW